MGGAGIECVAVATVNDLDLVVMAVQGRGYYGIGAAKKDFGFSNNMTLPLRSGYSWQQGDAAMPIEGASDRGRATFTVDRNGKVRAL